MVLRPSRGRDAARSLIHHGGLMVARDRNPLRQRAWCVSMNANRRGERACRSRGMVTKKLMASGRSSDGSVVI
jgi:hypothetical protein